MPATQGVALAALLALLLAQAQGSPFECVAGCLCNGKIVRCGGRHYFSAVPQVLPLDMEELNMTGCDIRLLASDSFARYKRLRRLELRGTQLQSIEQNAFRGMESIEKLFITGNAQLTRLQPGAFAHLNNSRSKHLNLQGNRIGGLEPRLFEGAANFRLIDFSHNPVAELQPFAFRDLYNVDFLHVPQARRIAPDAFARLTRVHQLNIQYWEVERATLAHTFRGLRRVKYLRIEVSNLRRVARDTFAGLETVEVIHLSNCELSYLEAPSFALIKNVRLIIIFNSYLSYLDQSLRPLLQQRLLSLNDSRVACECHNFWLLSRDSGMTVAGLRRTTCVHGAWDGRSLWAARYDFLAKCRGPAAAAQARRNYALRKKRRSSRLSQPPDQFSQSSVARPTCPIVLVFFLAMLAFLPA